MEKVLRKLEVNAFEFDDTDKTFLELEEEKKKKYIEQKNKEMQIIETRGYKIGVVFAEQYLSELGNYLAENNSIDFSALITSTTVSYRSIRKDVDVSAFAKEFGGGGHFAAAGSPIDIKKQIEYIKNLFI